MKAIIVTHPTQNFKACLYGLDYDKLCLLAEFRAKLKKTIKTRFKTIHYQDEHDLVVKTKGLNKHKITPIMYSTEIKMYFEL